MRNEQTAAAGEPAAPAPPIGVGVGALLWAAPIALAIGAAGWVAVGAVAGAVDRFDPLALLVLAMPLVAAGAATAHRVAPSGFRADRWWAGVLVLAVALGWWNGAHASAPTLADRAASVSAADARWLLDEGTLRVAWRQPELIEGIAGLEVGTPAAEAVTATSTETATPHGTAILLAYGLALWGDAALSWLPAVATAVGLLCFFHATRRWLESPAAAVAATTAVGIGFPMVFAARGTSGATLSFALVWAGVAVAPATLRTRSMPGDPERCALTGLLLGFAAVFDGRISTWIAVVGGVLVFGRRAIVGRAERLSFVLGATPGVALALLDAAWLSGAGRRDDALLALVIGVTAAAVIAVGWFRRGAQQPTRPAADVPHRSLSVVIPPLAMVAVAAAWVLTDVGALIGVPALLATAAAATRCRSLPASLAGVIVVLAAIVWSVTVALHPGDGPAAGPAWDGLVPVVFPALVLAAGLGIERAAGSLADRARPGGRRRALATAGWFLVLGGTAWATAPVRAVAHHDGLQPALDQLCGKVGRRSAVVLYDSDQLAVPVRGWCNADVAVGDAALAPAALAAIRSRDACREVFVVTPLRATPPGAERLLTPVVNLGVASDHSIDIDRSAPRRLIERSMAISIFQLTPGAACPPVGSG